jgi:hypothetical protein
VTGRAAATVPVSYWADSAFIAAAGIPTLLYGPDGDGAHADVEWVSLSGTETCARVLTMAATEFCARDRITPSEAPRRSAVLLSHQVAQEYGGVHLCGGDGG